VKIDCAVLLLAYLKAAIAAKRREEEPQMKALEMVLAVVLLEMQMDFRLELVPVVAPRFVLEMGLLRVLKMMFVAQEAVQLAVVRLHLLQVL